MEADPQSQLTAIGQHPPDHPDPTACADGRNGLRPRFMTLTVALALAAGLALRLWMLGKLFQVNGDSLIYGGIAKNLLLHGRYALEGTGGELYPTLIRLPGYSLFLALCFRLFGMENYFAAPCVQIGLELAGCLFLADFARRIAAPARRNAAAVSTLWIAALCPFTASYAAAPLTETATLFTMALALWAAARFQQRPQWSSALCFTFAITFAALLRPDGALVGVALAPAIALGIIGKSAVIQKNCHPERSAAELKDLRLFLLSPHFKAPVNHPPASPPAQSSPAEIPAAKSRRGTSPARMPRPASSSCPRAAS
jgi:hypothetical protein